MRRLGLCFLTVLLLPACSAIQSTSGPEYAKDDLSTDVIKALNRNLKQNGFGKVGKARSADCEDVPDIKKDAIADCTVSFSDGTEGYFRVTFQDDAGHFLVEAA